VLLANLVDEKNLTPGLSKPEIDERARDGRKDKHIEEDKCYVIDVIRLIFLYRKQLIVRVRVIGGSHVNNENHVF
jgi:hypothetical protein